jgi:fibronectin-binding autotransporter adhesin
MKTSSTIHSMFSNPPSVLNRLGWFHLAVAAILTLLAAPATFAEGTATLSGGDGSGSSSFNSAGLWTGVTGTPSAGNQYFTGANRLRSPAVTANASFTFGGDSLSIDAGGGGLLGKVNAAVTETLTLNGANGFYGLYLNGGTVYEGGNLNANGVTLAIAGTAFANSGTTTFIGATGKYATSQAEKLDFQSTISGSGNITVGGTGDSGDLSGIVQLDAANTISGTVSVIAPPGNSDGDQGVGNATYGLLDLNNLNALQNATLALGASFGTTNTTSFNSLANTGTFNVGALSGSGNVVLNDTAGTAVALSVGGNNSSTAYSGNLSGLGSLTKAGSGTMTLSGANTYTGFTVVSNGTLALASGALLANSSSITVNSGATFDVSSNAFTLATGQSLLGSGTNNGSITVASGAGIYGGLDLAYGTNTITTNLTLLSGAAVYMDLGTTFNGSKDLISIGKNLTLNNTVFHLKAPSTSVNLDTTDYVLTSVGGTTTGNPSLTWDVAPLNSAHYSIGKSGNNIILHYNSSLVPSGTGVASPNSVVHNQPVLITVTVTFSSNPINTVTVDASALGASSSLPLISAGGGNYTNTVVVATSTALGTQTLVATMTDSGSLVGTTPSFTVTVNTSSEVWNGGGANNLWSSNPNWQSGYAPGYVGDSLTFAGTTRLTPDMNAGYTISTLTFDGTAGSFTLGSSGGYGLTVTGGSIANNSANTQTLNVAIANAGNLVDVTGGNNIVFNGGIAGAGGLQNDNSGALILNGTNTFTGGININSGTLQIAGAGLLGDTNGNYSGNITNFSIFQYSSSATQTLAGIISFYGPIKDGSGKLILTANNTYTGDTAVSNGVLQIAGAGGLGYGSLGAGSTVDYYIGNLLVNGTFEYSSSAAQTIVNAITGTGGVLLDGSGTLTLNGASTYSGPTVVTGGTLVYSPNTITYPTINSLSIYSNGTVLVNVNNGASLPVGNLTLNSNSVLKLSYDFSGGNPTVAAVGVTNISAPGTNIVIRITGFGAAVGQFPLISYTGTPLANLNNFVLAPPAGVTANLTNNTANKTIDVNITASSPTTWIPLNAGDGAGTSSFNTAGNWNGGNPPTSGNGYYTQGFILRTPADSNPYTFGGSALSIDSYTPGSGSAGGRLLMKGSGGAVITITNLILNGGLVDYANLAGDNGIETLAGNITLNSGNTSFIGALVGETLLVTAPISGTGNLQFGGVDINSGVDTSVVALSGANTYSGSTTVATGTLLANGTIPNTPSVIVFTNATLGGTNSIGGAVTVQAGGTLAPGIAADATMWTNNIGKLTVGGAVSVSGAVVIKINDGVSPNSDKLVAPSVTISSGATLTVNNIGSTNLVAGDTFTLFSTPVSGSFTTVTLPTLPATNLAWTNKLAVNGSIAVVSVATVNTSPTNMTFTVSSGNQLILSWPADHIGWHLQAQTNSLSTGLSTNWVTIPGTDTVGSYTNTINPANGCVFYRMIYP